MLAHSEESTDFFRKILIIGDVTASKLKAIPLLNNTITRRLLYDIPKTLMRKFPTKPQALQMDEASNGTQGLCY